MPIDENLLKTGTLLVPTNPDHEPQYHIYIDDDNSCRVPVIDLLKSFIKYGVPTLWFFSDENSPQVCIGSQKEEFGDREPMGYVTFVELLNLIVILLKSANWSDEKLDKLMIAAKNLKEGN